MNDMKTKIFDSIIRDVIKRVYIPIAVRKILNIEYIDGTIIFKPKKK